MNRTKLTTALLVLAVIGIVALGFGSARYRGEASVQLTSGRNGPVTVTQDQNVEIEVITATPAGFEPTLITRPPGPFGLALHNKSGERELRMRILRTSGEQLQEVRLRPGSRRQHQLLDLPAGQYLITETNHPNWRCQLIVSR